MELRSEQDKEIKMQQLRMESEKFYLQLRHKLFGYLTEFYKKREISFDRIITFGLYSRIMSQGADYILLLPPDERAEKLHAYQEEMRLFTTFLNSTYFDSSHVHMGD